MAGQQPILGFEVPEGGDDAAIHAILKAHVEYESVRNLRAAWVHVLAGLGGALALAVVLPDLLPRWLTLNLPSAWALCCLATIATAIRERTWSRRRDRVLAEHPVTSGRES